MATYDLFSKRNKPASGVDDVYIYNEMTRPLRIQLTYIFKESLGSHEEFHTSYVQAGGIYSSIVDTLRREYGEFVLCPDQFHDDKFEEFYGFLLRESNVDRVIDLVELVCRVIERITTKYDYLRRGNCEQIAKDAIEELNARLKEHHVGYQYTGGEIIRVDSELIHAEVVKPALRLLSGQGYAGAQEEFLSAHEHYRHGRNKEALVDCLKAFESTMKAICDKHGWQREPNATASQLIKSLFEKELVPVFWQTQMNALKSSLESAVPTGRNRLAGHGQGSEPVSVPNYLAGYMLHMTAATILFLVEAEAALP